LPRRRVRHVEHISEFVYLWAAITPSHGPVHPARPVGGADGERLRVAIGANVFGFAVDLLDLQNFNVPDGA
jgi:hypothetical protein